MPKRGLLVVSLWLLVSSSFGAKAARAQTTTYYFSPNFEKEISGEQTIITKYYPLPGGAIAMRRDDELSYLHSDHLSSTRLITDSLGQKTEEFTYFPYGTRLTRSTWLTDRLYTSQILDPSTELYFYNARYYNPKTASFISADAAQGPNRYAYVAGNPISKTDPTGLQEWSLDQLAQTIWDYGGEIEGYDVMREADDPQMWKAGRVYAGRALFWERHEEQLLKDLNLQLELTFLSQAMAGENLGQIMIASAGQATTRAFLTMGPTVLEYTFTTISDSMQMRQLNYWKSQYEQAIIVIEKSGAHVQILPRNKWDPRAQDNFGYYLPESRTIVLEPVVNEVSAYKNQLARLAHEIIHDEFRQLPSVGKGVLPTEIVVENEMRAYYIQAQQIYSLELSSSAMRKLKHAEGILGLQNYPINMRYQMVLHILGYQ